MPPSRRVPTQARSRATVERIVRAGAEVLAEAGYHGASTNRIAAAAGVSPGTLYGYFSDKDEIVLAVIDDVVAGFGAGITPTLRTAATLDIGAATRMVLEGTLVQLERRAPLVRAFADRVPPDRYAATMGPLRTRVNDAAYQLLAAHLPAADPAVLERTTWIVVQTIEHLTVRYVLDAPRVPRAAFLDDLSRMVLSLVPPPAPRS